MILRKTGKPHSWNMVDKFVFTNRDLSDGAKVLYAYLTGLREGQNYSDVYLTKALSISTRALSNRKAELRKADLICINQFAPRIYAIYVGNTSVPASRVKANWENEEERFDV